MPSSFTDPLRRRIEASFAAGLRAQLDAQGIAAAQLPIFEGGGDNVEELGFFLVVACMNTNETSPQSGVFYIDLRLSLCCHIDLKTSAQHDAFHNGVVQSLRMMPRRAAGEGVVFHGWQIEREESVVEEAFHGDVFFIEGGVTDLNVV
jgi:hypothetical protein